VGEKGYGVLRIFVHAEPGHASMPWETDAPSILARGLGRLQTYQFPPTLLPPAWTMRPP
jgi:acetylornithine deacetylase/succinyl-diaminopimelate desuccinylase-like protein